MVSAAGELPRKPAVDGTEAQFAALGALACARHVIEEPREFGAGKVRIQQQPGTPRNLMLVTFGTQPPALIRSSPILPDDGACNRDAGAPIPQHRGFALIRDADGSEVARVDAGGIEDGIDRGRLCLPDLCGVVLDPARRRKMLRELALRDGSRLAIDIEHDGARTGRALVQSQNV